MANEMTVVEALSNIRDGGVLEELSENLRECAKATLATGKKSKLVLEITFDRNGQSGVKIADRVKVALPEAEKEQTNFYVTENGGLSRRDPKQPSLTLEGAGN